MWIINKVCCYAIPYSTWRFDRSGRGYRSTTWTTRAVTFVSFGHGVTGVSRGYPIITGGAITSGWTIARRFIYFHIRWWQRKINLLRLQSFLCSHGLFQSRSRQCYPRIWRWWDILLTIQVTMNLVGYNRWWDQWGAMFDGISFRSYQCLIYKFDISHLRSMLTVLWWRLRNGACTRR